MPIYTKKGDFGKTSIFKKGGQLQEVAKDSPEISSLGSLDEVNSFLGLTYNHFKELLSSDLLEVQRDVYTISSVLACSKITFERKRVLWLEEKIDEIESQLPPLREFIIPGGSVPASLLHITRSVTRRAEREVVSLNKKKKINQAILVYLNRLSDYLFVLARFVNYKNGISENPWHNPQK